MKLNRRKTPLSLMATAFSLLVGGCASDSTDPPEENKQNQQQNTFAPNTSDQNSIESNQSSLDQSNSEMNSSTSEEKPQACNTTYPKFNCYPHDCNEWDCGDHFGLDDRGCMRPYCKEDADCPEGFVCYDSPKCVPSAFTGILKDGKCETMFTGDCAGKYCIAKQVAQKDDNWPKNGSILSICDPNITRDPIDIRSAQADPKEQTISYTLKYKGGDNSDRSCKPHFMALCWDGKIQEEQGNLVVSVFIAHDSNNDPCKTTTGYDIEDGRTIDISPLLLEAKKKTNGAAGEIILKFDGTNNEPISFQF